MAGKRFRRQRINLWKSDPHCSYCGVLTILPEMRSQSDKAKGVQPDNMATIEHVYSRLHPNRHIFKQGEKRHILSCYKCNHERGEFETMVTFSEKHKKKSQNGSKAKLDKPKSVG